jgi:site-specific DNA-methyltransferase (adenine-specific)
MASLKADIARNKGLKFPVILYEGKILDGRHREQCCYELGIEPQTREFNPKKEGSPVDFVLSCGIHRSLSDSQKGICGGRMLKAMRKDPLANLNKGTKRADVEAGPRTRDVIANLFEIDGRYIQYGQYVEDHSPKLAEEVFLGKLPLSKAVREIHRNVKRKILARKAADSRLPGTFAGTIITGDCLVKMPTMPRRSIRLIFADPKYNQSIDYGDGEKADKLSDDEYLMLTAQWVAECYELLAPDGTMCVLISDEYAAEYAILLKKIGLHRRSWIKWYESFGVNCNNNFNRCSRHLFYCVKDERNFVFNADAFNRKSDRQTKYNDKRAAKGGKLWDNVWGITPPIHRLVDNSPERMPDFKTQLPLDLLKPIVAGFSDPGDMVLDPFSGSGTTVAAAKLLGRKGVGIEINPARAEQSRQRIAAV